LSALNVAHLKIASARTTGRLLLAGAIFSVAVFFYGAASEYRAIGIAGALAGLAFLYGAALYGYREWRAHCAFWSAAGLNDEQIRQKWHEQYDAGS